MNHKKILLADDDRDDRELIREMLEHFDQSAEIVCLQTGQEIFGYLSKCTAATLPDIIVLDYSMPLMNAAEVLEQLLEEQLFPHIPKVVWSTSSAPEHVSRCMASGAIAYFSKPVTAAELSEIALRILELCPPAGIHQDMQQKSNDYTGR
ncbi:response regulator receiver domain-containing protein [Chitinophaga dinghuensis]|uniref:Response regulator receiver domain-containing protein n=1 Tax=Chitinophaga dinghuensis TaxID=1539050 RepID=A0A327VZG5_9BACT|nr:response regulator [Chitinophaga dinghuensis]RAJ80315.1 response regulator receiver domain-containing protein [Chitinophaga dinghuensis]